MDLDAALAATEPDARRTRVAPTPKGWQDPGIDLEHGTAVITSGEELTDDHRANIEAGTGMPVPAHMDVKLERITIQQDAKGTAQRWWYKYKFIQRTSVAEVDDYDHVAALKALRSNRAAIKPTLTGSAAFGLSWNDWQTGKSAGGGTPALLARFDAQITAAEHRAKELRKIGRDLGELVIIGGGDIVEGCTIYPNQSFELDLDGRRHQVNVATDMVLYGLDRLAPLFERVRLLVVGGNHGENRINGHRTTRHDNDDCLVFENAARATARDPRLQHVQFIIAQDEPAKTLDVNGWIIGTTHGQAFGKGAGRPEVKAHNWFKGQAAGRHPAGDCDVLISHHYHHLAVRDWGSTLWVQTPANDGGSPQHTDLTGESAESGMLSWVTTRDRRWQDAQVL